MGLKRKLGDKRKLQPAGRANKAAANNRAFKRRHNLQYSGKRKGRPQKGCKEQKQVIEVAKKVW